MEKTSDNYSCLSSQRGRLMGAAMLMVVLFHVGGMRHDTFFYCLSRCGNVGVDMFLFLSGIGLWFSWGKIIGKKHAAPTATATRPAPRNASGRRGKRLLQAIAGSPYATSLRRRYVRVYPAWLIVAAAYYLPRCLDGRASAADTALSIAVNWGFWQHDELTFWFIPAIMALYTVAPAYIELIRRHAECRWMPVAAMVLCVLVQYWAPLHSVVGHLEIFFSRIPIFLIGINTGLLVEQRRHIGRAGWWMLIGMLAVCTLACVNFEDGLRGRFPLFLERMVYIPLTVSMALLMARALAHAPAWAGSVLAFIGGKMGWGAGPPGGGPAGAAGVDEDGGGGRTTVRFSFLSFHSSSRRLTASRKLIRSISIRKRITSPRSPQAKQQKVPRSGLTASDG